MARAAELGSHRTRSLPQLCGSRFTRVGITNSRPIIAVMVPAVFLMIAAAADANRPHRVMYSALPIRAQHVGLGQGEAIAPISERRHPGTGN